MLDKAGMSYVEEREPVANDEHLALLRQGVAIWNEWRERYRHIDPNLQGADLGSADLRGVNLRRADLRGVSLDHAKLSGANLMGADLRGVNLRDVDLRRVSLDHADLSGADLTEAELVQASLTQADLTETNLTSARLRQANLTEAILLWAKLIGAQLVQADFRRAILAEANLSGANLWDAHLANASLDGANLRGASLHGTNLAQSRLRGADLTGAELGHTILGDLNLTETIGLDKCYHASPSVINLETLVRSGNLPLSFLRGCGLPDNLIDYLPSLRGDAIQFYSCFISYSTKDQFFADRLHADLQNKGVRCWFAPHDLPIGAKTWDAIDEAIRLKEKLLLILSEASIASEWVEDEVNKAYAEERSRKEVVLFPIRIDNMVMTTAEPWAVKLRDQRNIGDFRRWKTPAEYQKSLDRLLRDLQASGVK
jgi:uncharacterized protein YjbI with pentapeptide repeats